MISAFEWCHPTFTRLAKTWLQKYDKFSASFTDQVRLGYLDVAIAKKIQKFVSETLKKQSQEYFVSESRGAPFECAQK